MIEPKGNVERVVLKWFKSAFPKKTYIDPSYFDEWVRRFKKGDPWVFMDSERLSAYLEMIKAHRGESNG